MIVIITGEKGQGKTTFIKRIVDFLHPKGINAGGFYSEVILEKQTRLGYRLVDVRTGMSKELCSESKKTGYPHVGNFVFQPETIQWGLELFGRSLTDELQVICLDEAGKLELNSEGWYPLLTKLNDYIDVCFVIAIRRQFVKDIVGGFGFSDPMAFDIKDFTPIDVSTKIIQTLQKRQLK